MTMNFRRTGVRFAVVAVCSAMLSGAAVRAQDASPAAANAGQMQDGQPNGDHQNGERMLDRMTKRLKLSADQVTQVKAIETDAFGQMKAVRDDSTVVGKAKRTKMMAIRQDSQTKIRAVLTDDQRPKYDEMLGRAQARVGNRKGAGGAAAAPAVQP
jgi:protein CpxP